MDAPVWTAIGLLAAMSLGTVFDARLDAMTARLDAMNARLDRVEERLSDDISRDTG